MKRIDEFSIVYCKDCVNALRYRFGGSDELQLACCEEDISGNLKIIRRVRPDDFCSYGRKV